MKERKGEHPFGDAGQLILLAIFLVVWIVDSFVLHFSTSPAKSIPLWIRLLFSTILVTVAGFLTAEGHRVVSHEERPNHVVSDGAFQRVRHPLYLASLLFYAGLSIATVSLAALAVWVGIFIFYNYIADYEEKLLESKFGLAYFAYKNPCSTVVGKNKCA
jgi:protein-S-isoprenylcysteine O-methyltransferase Ste14